MAVGEDFCLFGWVQMKYEGNPKHKEPWQRGRRGSLCPKEVHLPLAQKLLDSSRLEGEKRFAAHDGKAYCAMEHRDGLWHGFPVGWSEVPPAARNELMQQGYVTRHDIKHNWE